LFDEAGREIDRVVFGSQAMGQSIGRPSDTGSWRLLVAPTREAANSAAAPLGLITGLRLNEWLANSPPGGEDFVELFNPAGEAVELSDLRLTDDHTISGIDQFAFPDLSFIAAGGFMAFTADNMPGRGHLPFNLDADGETLRLYHPTRVAVIDGVTWGIEEEGVSSGRLPDGEATIGPLAFLSPGQSNASDPGADSDGDGLPDTWEDANQLNPGDPSDAALDTDFDGRTNLYEYLSGTDPQDRTSFLAIASMRFDDNGFTLEFPAHPGVRYTVQFSDDLAIWRTLTIIGPLVAGQPASASDPAAPRHRFYRLVAERP
nr:lamin tail domain-containing protein [Akkermansiaceae bacterium]